MLFSLRYMDKKRLQDILFVLCQMGLFVCLDHYDISVSGPIISFCHLPCSSCHSSHHTGAEVRKAADVEFLHSMQFMKVQESCQGKKGVVSRGSRCQEKAGQIPLRKEARS
uniref:Uncharacterized protein n=1 Tax=Sphaerodactylus townsendi TaxID=933632 RepID=A0ACB8G5A2_9SAUR